MYTAYGGAPPTDVAASAMICSCCPSTARFPQSSAPTSTWSRLSRSTSWSSRSRTFCASAPRWRWGRRQVVLPAFRSSSATSAGPESSTGSKRVSRSGFSSWGCRPGSSTSALPAGGPSIGRGARVGVPELLRAPRHLRHGAFGLRVRAASRQSGAAGDLHGWNRVADFLRARGRVAGARGRCRGDGPHRGGRPRLPPSRFDRGPARDANEYENKRATRKDAELGLRRCEQLVDWAEGTLSKAKLI